MRVVVILLWFVTWCRCEDEATAQLVSRLVPQWGPCRFTALAALHPAATHAALTALHAAEPLCPVTVTSRLTGPSQDSLWPERVTRLLVLVHHVEELHDFLDLASEDDNWNPRAKVILMLTSPTTTHEVHEALSVTWSHKYQLFDTVACVLDNNSSGAAVRLFTLMPQPPPACEQPALVELSTHVVFPRKLSNIGGCPLRVSNFYGLPYFYNVKQIPRGVNAKMLNLMSKKLNFTYILDPPYLEEHGFSNELYMKILLDTLNNNIDILSFPITNNIGELTNIFGWCKLSIMVPKADFLPMWMNLIIPFNKQVWIATLLTLIIETIFQIIYLPARTFWPDFTTLLGTSSQIQPVHKLSSRLYLYNLLLTGAVINIAYQTALYQSLTVPRRYPDINTIDDLIQSELPVVSYQVIAHSISQINEPKYISLLKQFVISNEDPVKKIHTLAIYRNSSYIQATLFLQHVQKQLYERENIDLHITEEVSSLLNCFVVPTGSPYLIEFNFVIQNVIESGLFYKWENDLMLEKKSSSIVNIRSKLSTKHFTSAFFALFIGYLCSFGVFLCEIAYLVYIKLGKILSQTI